MNRYDAGVIFKMYEDDSEEYVILKNQEIDSNLYLLVAPKYINEGNVSVNSKKMLVLRVDRNNDDFEFESDENIIRKVVENALEK